MIEINESIARKVLETVDAGLVKGVGNPVPGQMCVEAAVCYAMGLPHGDNPSCVSPALRELKIKLNDSNWTSNEARAKGLRKLAVAQLGSAGVLDDMEFIKRVVEMTIRVIVPIALRATASKQTDKHHQERLEQCAVRCEIDGTKEAADAADDANTAAKAAYADEDIVKILTIFADRVVDILVEMKAPGVKWLALCD